MNNKTLTILSSGRTTIITLIVYALMMASATIIEKYHGAEFAKGLVYYSPLLIMTELLLAVNIILYTWRKKTWLLPRPGYMMVHISIIIILIGAATTHIFSKDGIIHLRLGQKTTLCTDPVTGENIQLPFTIRLDKFLIQRYPGSGSPSSYESFIEVFDEGRTTQAHIYMNNVLDYKGWRLYQASYDEDEQGTILSASYDSAGRSISYLGYIIMTLGLMLSLLQRESRFRRVLSRLSVFLLLSHIAITAGAQISPEHHDKLGSLPVLTPSGRVAPLASYSSEILRKITGGKKIDGMDGTTFVADLLMFPKKWAVAPIVDASDKILMKHCGFNTPRISYLDAFDKHGDYRFAKEVDAIYAKSPALRTHIDRQMMKLDEKVNLLHQLFTYQLLNIFPQPGDKGIHHWASPGGSLSAFTPSDSARIVRLFRHWAEASRAATITGRWEESNAVVDSIAAFQDEYAQPGLIDRQRLHAETAYDKLSLASISKRIFLISGGLLLLITLIGWMNDKEQSPLRRHFSTICATAILAGLLIQTADIALRWYVSGHAPWSNSYETMVCLGWASAAGAILIYRHSHMTAALASIWGGVILFVSGLSWMDPQITPLVPVLKSPWLMFHVAVLIIGYGFWGISSMTGAAGLIFDSFKVPSDKIKRLADIGELSMILGLAFSTVGVLLGAVWANESWGRYWSWDPKETWALITVVSYAAVLHYRWFSDKCTTARFNLLSQTIFLTVLMTYFGVNYFLTGLHSYGDSGVLARIPVWAYIAFTLAIILPGTIWKLAHHSDKKQQNTKHIQ